MTGKVVGWAMEQVCGSPITKLVLIKLADNANDLGFCFPSIDLIVEHTELSERAVRKHLYELEKLGYIRIDRRTEEGVHFRNRYFLNIPVAEPREVKPKGAARRAIPMQAEQNQRLEDDQPVVRQNLVIQEMDMGESTPIAQGAIPLHGTPGPAASGAGPSCTPSNTLLHDVPVHIDEPPREPSNLTLTPRGEREGDQVDGPKMSKPLEDIPDFLVRNPFEAFMRAGPWHPATTRSDANEAWHTAKKLPPPIELIAAAKRYFTAMDTKNAKRRRDDPAHAVSAATFIKKAMWNDYPPPAPLLAPVQSKERRHLWGGHPAVEILYAKVGDGIFDTWYAVCRLTAVDGVPILIAPSRLVRDELLTKHWHYLEDAFNGPVGVQLQEQEPVAA